MLLARFERTKRLVPVVGVRLLSVGTDAYLSCPNKVGDRHPLDMYAGQPRNDSEMSALPPKADMCGAQAHVCYGPEADVTTGYAVPRTARTAKMRMHAPMKPAIK
jgi:hypothetical protein